MRKNKPDGSGPPPKVASGQAKPIKLLIVDDHQLLLDTLRDYFQARPEFAAIETATDAPGACEKAREFQPDVVLMDVQLPGTDGVQATKLLRKVQPRVRVLAVSAYQDQAAVLGMIRAGACGFVAKHGRAEELLGAIRTVLAGRSYFSPEVSCCLGAGEAEGGSGPEAYPLLQLTAQERRVLVLVSEGLSNKESAGRLGISVRTVEKHRELLRRKLRIRSVAQATKLAVRCGVTSLN